ncbi:cobalamin-binding protein [Bacillus shivajii]|uniref:cobalamin-binding protein n=1 Tax=Bacillus shivajii TaxID=1983719 RepID=UPI001CF9C690|nr:cobalamin-binding protein [Bacillus shivajii]UCZ55162.1 cobalamin-binding protein [Bacillus shivajii]
MKLISICPSNTELVHYLGLTDQLIAVDDYSDWPNEVKQLPRVGPDLNIDMDHVESLKPDLVLASLTVPGMEKNIDQLEKRGIPYKIVPNPKTFADIGYSLTLVGEWTNVREQAIKVKEKYFNIIEQYKELSKNVQHPKQLYWEWWPKPIFTPGRANWLTEMSDLAGGQNVFATYKEASVQTDWEEVIEKNPDVVCLVWVGVQQDKVKTDIVRKRQQSGDVKAISHNEIYVLEEPFFCRPSPRLLIGLMKIAHLLHPHIYPKYEEGYDPLK